MIFLVPFSLFFNVNDTSLKKIIRIFLRNFLSKEEIFQTDFDKKPIIKNKIIQANDINEVLGSKIENKFVII